MALVVKNLPAKAGDMGLISGLARSPGVANGSPLRYSCLENAMDRGAWGATVPGDTESDMTETKHAFWRPPNPFWKILVFVGGSGLSLCWAPTAPGSSESRSWVWEAPQSLELPAGPAAIILQPRCLGQVATAQQPRGRQQMATNEG